jgi:hypothetical protein
MQIEEYIELDEEIKQKRQIEDKEEERVGKQQNLKLKRVKRSEQFVNQHNINADLFAYRTKGESGGGVQSNRLPQKELLSPKCSKIGLSESHLALIKCEVQQK